MRLWKVGDRCIVDAAPFRHHYEGRKGVVNRVSPTHLYVIVHSASEDLSSGVPHSWLSRLCVLCDEPISAHAHETLKCLFGPGVWTLTAGQLKERKWPRL